MKKILTLLVLSAMTLVLSSSNTHTYTRNQRTVSGVVSEYWTRMVIPGVNINVKGTSWGTTTDADGRYSLAVPDYSVTLVFTFVGCSSLETDTGAKTYINVELECIP